MFLSRHASAGASAGGDRSPWGSFWFEPVGMRSSTGLSVNAGSAMRLSAVYSCVRVLSETFAVLPFCLYRKQADGGRQQVTDHWLYRLLARRPNEWQTPFEWREMMMGHLALRGNAFNQIFSNGKGEITDLVPIHPDRVHADVMTDGNYRYRVMQLDGTEVLLSRGEVWHLRGLSSDGIVGLNPIEIAADVLGLGVAAQNYGARFFANDAKPGGWIEMTGKFADDVARQTFKASWAAAQSGGNRGKTAVFENGMKYHELSLNNSDAQFLETRKYSRSEIASLFRVPPHKIGDLEKATFSNIEQQSLEFVNDTMTPWAERWESSIETFLMLDGEDLEVEFDFANLLRGDSAARAIYLKAGINDGWLTRNEARISEGRNPIEGLDEPLRPLNMVENNSAADELAEPADAKDDAVPPAAAPDARLQALVQASAQRLARRASAALVNTPAAKVFDSKFAALVADALAIDIDKAEGFCSAARLMTATQTPNEPKLASQLAELGEAGQSAPDQTANALVRLATAISQQPPMAAPVVNVTLPQPTAPVVHNTVNLPETKVTIDARMPDQPAPVVNVTNQIPQQAAPQVRVFNDIPVPEVNINLPARKTTGTVERDALGHIVRTTQIETDL